jgi:mannitol/fructose-specific phosphotransferase system IIA component (Ntr-type)
MQEITVINLHSYLASFRVEKEEKLSYHGAETAEKRVLKRCLVACQDSVPTYHLSLIESLAQTILKKGHLLRYERVGNKKNSC